MPGGVTSLLPIQGGSLACSWCVGQGGNGLIGLMDGSEKAIVRLTLGC